MLSDAPAGRLNLMDSHSCSTHQPLGKSANEAAIEPKILAELAEKALRETKDIKNPYLRAVMTRFARAALELKLALEGEIRS